MSLSTRDRLIRAATDLFADHGYRGASVRAICNLARANPGAVSYHFGGKRQLYRTVLRHAAERLAEPAPLGNGLGEGPADLVQQARNAAHLVARRTREDPATARLMLRDLADGGDVAVEALAPALRRARAALSTALGETDGTRPATAVDTLFLDLAAPLALLIGMWPVVERALDLDEQSQDELLTRMIDRAMVRSGSPSGA